MNYLAFKVKVAVLHHRENMDAQSDRDIKLL